MNKEEARNHMTEQEVYVFDLLDKELMSVYQEKENLINEVNKEFSEYCGSLISEMGDEVTVTARCSEYSFDVRVRKANEKGYGSEITIYLKEDRRYRPEYTCEFMGIELNGRSARIGSSTNDPETKAYILLQYKLMMDMFEGDLVKHVKTYYDKFTDHNSRIDKASSPVNELIRKVSDRVTNEKIQKVTQDIQDGKVFEYTEGERVHHIEIVKVNKTTSHVEFYRNGFRYETKMRMKNTDLIPTLTYNNYKVVDKSNIQAQRNQTA